jgi:hypothetical protein
MTQDEIIEMARQAGFRVGPSREGPDDVWGVGANLERFAKLVAAAEREACAKVADHMASRCNDIRAAALESAAENIRARGQA